MVNQMRSLCDSRLVRSLAAMFLLGAFAKAGAQKVPRIRLGPAIATLPEEFSGLRSVRELSDGRVLLADPRDPRIVLADFEKKTVRVVGMRGSGPGEYLAITALRPFGRDSTAMIHEDAHRWTIVDPDLKFSTLPADQPTVAFNRNRVLGADLLGHVLLTIPPTFSRGRTRDTIPLLLVSWKTLGIDTIGRIDAGPRPAFGAGGPAMNVWPEADAMALSSDGYVAIVRHNPYRVEWRGRDGRWTIGAPIVDARRPTTDREKKTYIDRRMARLGANPATAGLTSQPSIELRFPETVPHFEMQEPLASAQGDLLVERVQAADEEGPLYDVFDRRGQRSHQLALAPNEKILGFGSSSVFLVSTDANGLQTVRKHRWPVREPGRTTPP